MEKKEKKKKKYPVGAENYTLYEEVGSGVSASVHRALCIPLNEIVAIKIMDFERDNCDLNNVSREAQTMVLVDHPNVLKSHCSFVNDHSLWVVMPFMSGGSCLHILKSAYPDGFDEVIIATVLREVLKGLDYLHSHGHIHRDVKAGNILIDAHGGVKLGDFGVSACLFDSGDRQKRDTFTGTPCWMAPEIMEQVNGYDYRCDIWSFGITCLEFAHGHAPFSKYPPMKVLLMTLQNAPPGLDYERDKKFSKLFKQMTASCLVKDPSQRPSAKKLLKHSFFKQARSNDYIVKRLLEGLPALGDRLMELKKKEEDMLAQKKIPYGQKEEMSQNEYKRGISAWDFNIEDLKAQASLIQDDDIVADKDQKGSTSSLQELDTQGGKIHQQQFSCTRLCSDATESGDNNQPALPISADPTCTSTMVKDEKFDDDMSIGSSAPESCDSSNSSIQNLNNLETNLAVKFESDDNGKSPESDKFQVQSQSASSYNSDAVPQKVGGMPSESSSRAPRASVGNGVVDEKAKGPVVEQRGRFKVTSENVEFEKVGSPLQKSQSMQVISQHPAVVSSPVMPTDATQPNITNSSLYSMILSLLETNIRQREHILNIMKQFANGDSTVNRAVDNGGCTQPTNTTLLEKSSLESAHDREKDLISQLTDLQWKLILAQEELQKHKTERPQPDF